MEMHTEAKSLFPVVALLPLIILIEGFVSIAIEILTIRQLLPVVGGSVIVTSIIIGFFLLFLALGYQKGGKLRQSPHQRLRINFFVAAVWFGVGLSYIFISQFFSLVEKFTDPHVIYPLVAYLLLIIAPLIYLLGQTVPITMNMTRQDQSVGTIGGNTMGLSTLGSFLGATMTTLVIMYYFGVAWTILINFILLLMLNLLLADRPFSFAMQLILAGITLWLIYTVNIQTEKNLFVLTNNYANYQILDSRNSGLPQGEKMLIINEAGSSYLNNERKSFPYIEGIKKILFNDLKLRDANILVLGAGGFSLSAEYTYGNHFTYVDIDSQIKKVTVPRFIDAVNSTLVTDDARHYLQSTTALFQAIVIDVYSDIKSIPAHLLTKEYMSQIKNRLIPGGTAIFNIIANPMLSDPYSKRIDNTIRATFASCMAIPHTYADRATNILYVCNNGQQASDRKIYSDNFNNSTTDSFSW
ncbi:fused MFS/spermidine synthase [Aquicella lusitana]|uniref:Putative membrane-bound spermidine synthase n=1 Tax=Aquicella lusitana TaxID=254246 RepID=A0A370GLE4_9COXI|nr:fused MFS/spermidine synthase [Aquicella lusitana]RDI44535.1 putative membrane-bound spermidine synthase [Aquicella lusitana]VVC72523.1 Polyamine aminopropyltransferase [Aquicella lusitana]